MSCEIDKADDLRGSLAYLLPPKLLPLCCRQHLAMTFARVRRV